MTNAIHRERRSCNYVLGKFCDQTHYDALITEDTTLYDSSAKV